MKEGHRPGPESVPTFHTVHHPLPGLLLFLNGNHRWTDSWTSHCGRQRCGGGERGTLVKGHICPRRFTCIYYFNHLAQHLSYFLIHKGIHLLVIVLSSQLQSFVGWAWIQLVCTSGQIKTALVHCRWGCVEEIELFLFFPLISHCPPAMWET